MGRLGKGDPRILVGTRAIRYYRKTYHSRRRRRTSKAETKHTKKGVNRENLPPVNATSSRESLVPHAPPLSFSCARSLSGLGPSRDREEIARGLLGRLLPSIELGHQGPLVLRSHHRGEGNHIPPRVVERGRALSRGREAEAAGVPVAPPPRSGAAPAVPVLARFSGEVGEEEPEEANKVRDRLEHGLRRFSRAPETVLPSREQYHRGQERHREAGELEVKEGHALRSAVLEVGFPPVIGQEVGARRVLDRGERDEARGPRAQRGPSSLQQGLREPGFGGLLVLLRHGSEERPSLHAVSSSR